jgi:hypothetical protein
MELSEAIKAGAKLRPQNYGSLAGWTAYRGEIGSCALGAACEVVGALHIEHRSGSLTIHTEPGLARSVFPLLGESLTNEDAPCACEAGEGLTVSAAIAHLNDTHRWTREQIAAWVKGLEK